ncbi:putative RNA 2'-phosphotransferase [Devosia sp. UYZn731]|uniref:RNA 2'-phosphotransferase n=1 Tax=Devosia sp. UYZn731 TaxID=3156345 RepID=UPI0033961926
MTETSNRTQGMKELGRLLSNVLRHAPERLGITIDEHGWTPVEPLIAHARKAGFKIDRAILERVVAENDKQRFTLSADGQRIRAAQGHSIPIDLGLPPSEPPEVLFHGTARHNLDAIFAKGLLAGRRRHVHLSLSQETAIKVGGRHGTPVVLRIAAGRMHADGIEFWRADNGVWLTVEVSPAYLSF